MRSFWSDPYLWIHLAGFAALPLWLELCWLGLAAGDPVLPFWLELLIVAAIGIAPIFWMQWQRPFYIFSLIAAAVKPTQLTEDQRRLLSLFKAQRNRYLAIAGAILAFLALRQLYYLAPIAAPVTPFSPESRWLGLLVAAIAFLGVNLFLQVPISVLSVLLTGEATFAATIPYPLEQIRSDFTLLGIPVNQILPAIVAASEPQPVTAATAASTVSTMPEIPVSESPATVSPSPASDAEATDVDAEDWFGESPPTIPDRELERLTGDVSAEPTTTEVDLDTDLWEPASTSPAEESSEEAISFPGEPEVSADSSKLISELLTPHEEIPGVGELVNPSDIFNAEPIAEPQSSSISDSDGNVTEFVIPEEDSSPEAIADSEASTPLPSTHHPPEDHKE